MKKTLLIALVALFSVTMANAQPRAIGGRVGYNFDFVYQHSLSEKTFIELNAGLLGWWEGAHIDFLHEWIWLTPNWTPKGEWNWFAGVGANVGFKWNDPHNVVDRTGNYPLVPGVYNNFGFVAGAVANIGLEYTFWFPLSLAFDFRPTLGVIMGDKAGDHVTSNGNVPPVRFFMEGLFDGAFSVRYRF